MARLKAVITRLHGESGSAKQTVKNSLRRCEHYVTLLAGFKLNL